jgi:hypothetical protein
MFHMVPPPIIRCSKLYKQHRVFVKPLLLSFAIVEVLFQLLHDNDLANTRCCMYRFELLVMGERTA